MTYPSIKEIREREEARKRMREVGRLKQNNPAKMSEVLSALRACVRELETLKAYSFTKSTDKVLRQAHKAIESAKEW